MAIWVDKIGSGDTSCPRKPRFSERSTIKLLPNCSYWLSVSTAQVGSNCVLVSVLSPLQRVSPGLDSWKRAFMRHKSIKRNLEITGWLSLPLPTPRCFCEQRSPGSLFSAGSLPGARSPLPVLFFSQALQMEGLFASKWHKLLFLYCSSDKKQP